MDDARYPDLKFLSPDTEVQRGKNRVPHWQQDGRTYFLTFRLNDSIPQHLLKIWREERDAWCAIHPLPRSEELEKEYHRLFSLKIEGWLDKGMGNCLIGDVRNAERVCDALKFFDGDRYGIHAFVVMPNHVHLLLSLHPASELSMLVAGWKRFTARQIGKGPIWQKSYFDRMIRDWDHFGNVVRYIQRNPTRARLGDDRFSLYLAPWVEKFLGGGAIF